MTPIAIGLTGIASMFVLFALRVPIGIALILVGSIGFASVVGVDPALRMLGTLPFEHSYVYELCVIPMFLLMGNFAILSGISRDAFTAAYALIGHWRGGLASATVSSCAIFAAVSGSSLATAATMGQVALPEMRKYKYSDRLATGVVAAGGTLGILIPPSTAFILYGLLTQQSIGQLFLAGFLPGLLLTILFIATVFVVTRLNPAAGPAGPRTTTAEKVRAVRQSWSIFALVFVVIGGIYSGIFTPNEAAAVGAFFAMLLALLRRKLNLTTMRQALADTVNTTVMIMLILIGAYILNPFLAVTNIPQTMADFVDGLDASPMVVLCFILLGYIILGTFFESYAMLVLTLPVIYPLIMRMGYDPIWFGVLMVIVIEMGMITPPVGLNVFVVKGIAKDVTMREIFIGIAPFWIAMLACLILVVAFPQIALFLPQSMAR
jgi:tripartite ATP-independent transporter DctM subunit